jgi:serine/threonine-protein kinase ULK4
VQDKVNVLAYFETLCTDTTAANVLINSSLTILFVRMLSNARAPTLRVRLASVIGLLVRHATFIADELAQTGVLDVLADTLRDKNERVRRRAMATLGELLFYIATQQQDAQAMGKSGDVWQVPPSAVAAVLRLLKVGEDEIAQHYAVKTVENIGSQNISGPGNDWGSRLSTPDTVAALVQVSVCTLHTRSSGLWHFLLCYILGCIQLLV